MPKLFSSRNRAPHLGPYPLERLPRSDSAPSAGGLAGTPPLRLPEPENPYSIANSFPRFFELYRRLRNGEVREHAASIPWDPEERLRHLKSLSYFLDASQVGACLIPEDARLGRTIGVKFDVVSDSDTGDQEYMYTPSKNGSAEGGSATDCSDHDYALVILVEYSRDPSARDPLAGEMHACQAARAVARAAEVAVVIAMYLRRLGWPACAHTANAGDLDTRSILLNAGLAEIRNIGGTKRLANPFLGERFGAAVVSTSLEIGVDRPLAARGLLSELLIRPAYWLGVGGARPGWGRLNGAHRGLAEGIYPMERIKRVESPTTRIHAGDIKRQPKRAEFFTRAAFGDIGPGAEREMHHGRFSEKEPIGATMSAVAAEMIPLQYGEPAKTRANGSDDPEANAARIRALSHFLGADIVGITPAYEHTWYSHHMDGKPIEPYHKNAIVLVLDQSQETMSGSSGDDWISNSQSFRAYMRGAFLASVIAEHIRGLGWSARSHTVWEEDVQHIPLCIHSGIGELSRIGETVLNPFLGPRFKDSIVTTDMPLAADKYVDFGLQDFCNKCTKCARECPCDAIPYGDKILFNGYEIWKPDVQRCANYRITNSAGSVCGRCMATCPFQTEDTLFNRALLWAGIHLPFARASLAKFDDWRGNGEMNPVKKWWWDLEEVDGKLAPAKKVNARPLFFKPAAVRKKEHKVAVFPPHMSPPADCNEAFPVDRKAGLAAQQQCAADLRQLEKEE